MQLENKVVIVTGAGSGIGAATAILCAANGAKVVLSDVNLDNAQNVANGITEAGGTALVVGANVTKYEEVENLINSTVEVYGRLKENIQTTDEEEDVNRHLFILFVKDYVVNPNLDNSMCNPGAIEKFGVMPSLKGKLSEDERQAIAEWLYDRYENITF